MTERWRKKLEGIDQVGPTDDVYQRAKAGPTLPEPQSPMQRTSTRVATTIAAFVVFALAISLFAIPTLRLHGGSGALSAGGQLLPLWPARTVDEVHALQAQADSGDAAWALDPREIATRFGRTVLGWPGAWAGVPLSMDPACVPPGAYANSASPVVACVYHGTGSIAPADLGNAGSVTCGAGFLLCGGVTTSPPSPFMEFQVLPCAPVDRCEPTYDGESVTLFQPAGSTDGGIWAVLEASSAYLRLSVVPGAIVRDADTLTALSAVPDESRTTLAYETRSGQCAASDSTSAFKPVGSEAALPVPNAGSLAASDAQLDVHLTGTGASCDTTPGYVFSAIRGDGSGTEPLQDPIAGATNDQALAAFSAAPVTFEWPEEVAASTPPPSNPSLSWKTYTSGLGFRINVPSDWGITDVTDELIVSAPGGDPYVQINRVPNDPLRDDSSFPLNYAAMANDPQAHFRGDGQAFIIQWLTGDGSEPTPEEAAEFDRITSSIAFPATKLGAMEGGWTAVGPILQSASAEWVTDKLTSDHYIAALTGGSARTAFGPAPTCPGGGGSYEVRETGVAGIACSDGTGGDWDFTAGEPKAGNSAGFDVPLHEWPALRSWDGWLLLQLPTGPTPTPSPP